jgi:hypothetical protein
VLVDDFESINWTSGKRNVSLSSFAVNGSSMKTAYTTGTEDYGYLVREIQPSNFSYYQTLEFDVYLNYSGAGNPKLGVVLWNGTSQLYPANWAQYPRKNAWSHVYVNVSNLDRSNISRIYVYVYKNKDSMPSGQPIEYYFDNMYFSNNYPALLNPVVEDFEDVTDWSSTKRTFVSDTINALNGSSMRIHYTTGAEDFGFVSKSLTTEQDWSSFNYLDIDVYLNYSSTGNPKFGIVLVDASNNQLFPSNWAQYPTTNEWNHLRFDISSLDRRHIKKVNIYVYKQKDNMPQSQEITYYLDNLVLN